MASIKTLDDINAALAEFIPLSAQVTGKNITLDRMKPLMELFGNPQDSLKVIHIAGTSGKTSTAYYIASLLTQAELKTGLTVSPHVDSVAERVQINMQPIGEIDFAVSLTAFLNILETSDIEPTYFELLVALAYWYFAKNNVDYAVIETGMGGLHDGTNVASRPDKLCVITDIGLDHMHVLGSTVEEIAAQKAGIIHEGNSVVMYEQADNIMQVIQAHCVEVSATLVVQQETHLTHKFEVEALEYVPKFQKRNWLLAAVVYEQLQLRDGLLALSNSQLAASLQVQVPARMESVVKAGKRIIMDGAHNEQKMQAFVASLLQESPGNKVPVLLSLKRGKEFMAVLPLLKPITDVLILTEFSSGQDVPAEPLDSRELALAAKQFGFETIVVEKDAERAYAAMLAQSSKTAIITGSFYLIAQLRRSFPELRHA